MGLAPMVRPLSRTDLSRILEEAEAGRFAPLRYLRLFGHDIAGREQREQVELCANAPGACSLIVEIGSEVRGAVTMTRNEDLSSHFDLDVYQLGPVLTMERSPAERAVLVSALLDGAYEQVRDGPTSLTMLRLEADDRHGLRGATSSNFAVLESTLTFVNDLARAHLNPPRPSGHDIRIFRPDVEPPLPADIIDPLRGEASRMVEDHYHADPRLPNDRCDALYERVLERALEGIGADVLVMRYHEDRVASLGTWRRWTELDHFGVDMAGSSFGFRSANAPPGNEGVTWLVCNEALVENRLLEWSTQATNYPMVNMLFRQPSIRHCRTSFMLHRWSDGGWS